MLDPAEPRAGGAPQSAHHRAALRQACPGALCFSPLLLLGGAPPAPPRGAPALTSAVQLPVLHRSRWRQALGSPRSAAAPACPLVRQSSCSAPRRPSPALRTASLSQRLSRQSLRPQHRRGPGLLAAAPGSSAKTLMVPLSLGAAPNYSRPGAPLCCCPGTLIRGPAAASHQAEPRSLHPTPQRSSACGFSQLPQRLRLAPSFPATTGLSWTPSGAM
ncbi:hypothetical protein NDU88_007189 [Pleurodeles waltl]|uniref:Uncharacterized protein n=1 Tax=Pleurodeles waltl TaxID=8319 RepID=A0AAV7PP40_PLEWA|nr:hypothetical protein NDU88_007189 [Pleurodeles waltl]